MLYKSRYVDSLLNKIIGEVLKEKREYRKMSLNDLSLKLNKKVSRQTLSTYENGRSKITIDMFIEICNVLNYDYNEVFDEINMKYFKLAKL